MCKKKPSNAVLKSDLTQQPRLFLEHNCPRLITEMGDPPHPVDGVFLSCALSESDLVGEACAVAPADGSGGLLDQLLAPWLPTWDGDNQSCAIFSETECAPEPAAAAADASAGNMQGIPMAAHLAGSKIGAIARDLGTPPGAPDQKYALPVPAPVLDAREDGVTAVGSDASRNSPVVAHNNSLEGLRACTALGGALVLQEKPGLVSLTRKRAAETAVPWAYGTSTASSHMACAAQSPALIQATPASVLTGYLVVDAVVVEHSSSSKPMSADDYRRAQNRKHAADCRARQRASLATTQQVARDRVAKVEFLKACCSEQLPVLFGPDIMATFDQATSGASAAKACAAHSGKHEHMSADEYRRAQNRKHAADCRARQRASLATAQQEVYDNDAKIEFLKACCSNLPSGPSILAKFDQFAKSLQ